MMQPSHKPGNQRQPQKSSSARSGKGVPPGMLMLIAVLGIVTFAILPRSGQQPAQQTQTANPEAAAVTVNNDENNIHVTWGFPVSQQNFWFDNIPAGASCDQNNCTLLKRSGMRQIYFRWFNNSENRWYYFQCPANYQGTFQGIPYTSK